MITKEKWEELEREAKGYFFDLTFKLEDTEILIHKDLIAENKLGYVVFLDGAISFSYSEEKDENFKPITHKVWHKKTKALYRPSEVKRLEKMWGKRRVKKEFPDIEKKIIYYTPYFEKFSVLKRQFSKIKELELVEDK